MARQKLIAAFFAVISTGYGFCHAQTDESKIASDAQRYSSLDAIQAEYRELICSRAADTSYAEQDRAIDLALQYEYVDPRFNALVRKVMTSAAKPDHWDVKKVAQAEKLLPLCTLDSKERAELVFRCFFILSDDSSPDRRLRSKLKKQLEFTPDDTSRLVLQRMKEGDYPEDLFQLVGIIGKSSEATLPLLMQAAKSDDSDAASWAMGLIPGLIEDLRRYERKELEQAEMEKLGVQGVDPKIVEYARRIIARYDTNGDQQLVPAEYKKMLQSPAAADLDANGRISLGEYAAWMQSRTKGSN